MLPSEELNDYKNKLRRLEFFINGEKFKSLSCEEKDLLLIQQKLLKKLIETISKRIDCQPKKEENKCQFY